MKIAIVDYGMGNIASIVGALNYIGVNDVVLSNDRDVLISADKLVLPGVGNFSSAMNKIRDLELSELLIDLAKHQKPLLGICLGMQLLAKSSTESGFSEGLGVVDGIVEQFEVNDLKVPHVGFNQVIADSSSRLFRGISEAADFYFTHSFRLIADSKVNPAHCNYGEDFVAGYEFGNVAGVQFHPELSQANGLRLLKNFVELF